MTKKAFNLPIILLTGLVLISPLHSQNKNYLYPLLKGSLSHYYLFPVIPLKKLMQIAQTNEIQATLKLEENIQNYCKIPKKHKSQQNILNTLQEQNQIWVKAMKQYEDQLAGLLQKELLKKNASNVLHKRLAIKNLRLKRQNIIKDIWIQIISNKHDNGKECSQFGIEILNKNKAKFNTKPIYLAKYRFWKDVPLIKREKIINILSN